MSDKAVTNAFRQAWKRTEAGQWVPGLLGKPNGAGGFTVQVADRPGHYYVRVSTQGILTVTTARTAVSVPARAGLPVKMRIEPGSGYVIYALDATATLDAATANDAVNVYGLPQHGHALDSGMSYMTEAMRMEPGLVHPAGGWSVTIEPFRYYHGGTWQTYAGETLPLAGNKPSTSGKHRLVVIAVDPATNTAVAVDGSDQNYATALGQEDIDSITIGDVYPLAAILIRNDDTSIETQSKYIDARGWLNYSDSLTFSDAEGDPETVTDTAAAGTSDYAARRDHAHAYEFDNSIGNPPDAGGSPSQGSSDWPARRDHIHGIADDSVSNAKLRNSGALSVIGRSANSSGDPADISATATSGAVLREDGASGLSFGTVATAGIADGAVTNAKRASMAEARISGRGAGVGAGAPTDLTPVQVMAVIGGVLAFDNNGDGNVGTGEDTLTTTTIAAGTLVAFATMRFEITGNWGGNGNTKRLRVYWGGNVIFDYTTTTASEFWTVHGSVICVGDASQKIWAQLVSPSDRDYQHSQETVDATNTITFAVTGEATLDDDIVVETTVLTWSAPFV